jgi:cytochrome c
MNPIVRTLAVGVTAALAFNGAAVAGDSQMAIQMVEAQNPCAAKNPCAGENPCAAKNPCGAKNPCAAAAKVDPKLVTRPAGTKLSLAGKPELVKEGERLWKDTKLSTNNLACNTCHQSNASFKPTFAKPYPHLVEMPKDRAGLKQVNIDEMVQLCMVIPMASKPLAWDSKELAALSAYSLEVQKTFKPGAQPAAANPCASKNPCATKNPCAAKNPCAPKK